MSGRVARQVPTSCERAKQRLTPHLLLQSAADVNFLRQFVWAIWKVLRGEVLAAAVPDMEGSVSVTVREAVRQARRAHLTGFEAS